MHAPGETKRQPHAADVEHAYSVPGGLRDAIFKGGDDIPALRARRRTLLASSIPVFVLTLLLAALCDDAIQQKQTEPDYTPYLFFTRDSTGLSGGSRLLSLHIGQVSQGSHIGIP